MSGKEWVRNMIGVWRFDYEKRDIRDKKIHPAVFPIALVRRIIELFTHRGEVVLDCFNGVGTTLVACNDTERHGIGIDLNQKYCNIAKNRLKDTKLYGMIPKLEVISEDAINLRKYIPDESIDLFVTSPPYANILDTVRTNKSKHTNVRQDKRLGITEKYSDNPRDLGNMDSPTFIEEITKIFKEIYSVLKPEKRCVINIRDVVPYFIHIPLIKSLERIGFTLKNIIIWDKSNLIQRMGIFGYPSNFIALNSAYEYILDFKKELETC
ncbi:MAG: DNA methyltransferase [Candidatus Heimdallarchaeota archaeon]